MPQENATEALHPRRAGRDARNNNVVACLRCRDRPGKVLGEIRTFPTTTADLLALADWLAERGVTHGATGSTGVYREPVFNLLAGGAHVPLVNAGHTKQMPGRKTDVSP